MRSVSPVLARRAISRNEKREQRAFGVEFFSSSREEEERKRSREKKDEAKRSKPTHLECKSAGKKNKLGGSNNKEICFSSNTHTHRESQSLAPLPPRRHPFLNSFFKRIHTRTDTPARTQKWEAFESYLALVRYVLRDLVLSHVVRQLLLPSVWNLIAALLPRSPTSFFLPPPFSSLFTTTKETLCRGCERRREDSRWQAYTHTHTHVHSHTYIYIKKELVLKFISISEINRGSCCIQILV